MVPGQEWLTIRSCHCHHHHHHRGRLRPICCDVLFCLCLVEQDIVLYSTGRCNKVILTQVSSLLSVPPTVHVLYGGTLGWGCIGRGILDYHDIFHSRKLTHGAAICVISIEWYLYVVNWFSGVRTALLIKFMDCELRARHVEQLDCDHVVQ